MFILPGAIRHILALRTLFIYMYICQRNAPHTRPEDIIHIYLPGAIRHILALRPLFIYICQAQFATYSPWGHYSYIFARRNSPHTRPEDIIHIYLPGAIRHILALRTLFIYICQAQFATYSPWWHYSHTTLIFTGITRDKAVNHILALRILFTYNTYSRE